MINLTIGRKNPHHYICLTKEIQDLHIWEIFFQSFNGKSFFLEEAWATSCQLRFYTDAAKSQGYGIVFGRPWAYGEWPNDWKTNRNISFLEFFSNSCRFKHVVSHSKEQEGFIYDRQRECCSCY